MRQKRNSLLQPGCGLFPRKMLVIPRNITTSDRAALARIHRYFRKILYAPDGIGGPLRPLHRSRYTGYPSMLNLLSEEAAVWMIPAGAPIPSPDSLKFGQHFSMILVDKRHFRP